MWEGAFMSSHAVNYTLPTGDRVLKRKNLISIMLEEECGTGRGERCSRYTYFVESYDEYGIYLKRPTQLNKGFDFTVNVSGMWFKKNRRYSNPSHQDIFDALLECKTSYPKEYKNIKSIIARIYECKDIDFTTPLGVCFHDFEGIERPIEIILLSIKWLFMEQDCAYWNYSGRKMLYTALSQRDLV